MLAEIVDRRIGCNAEVGSIAHGWRECGCRAHVFSERELTGGARYRLYFCERHQSHAWQRGPGYRVVESGRVVVEKKVRS